MSHQIILPRILQIGGGASLQVANVLTSLGCHKPLIITDKMMVKLGYVNTILQTLAEAKIQADVFDDTVPEPTIASIQAGVNKIQQGQ